VTLRPGRLFAVYVLGYGIGRFWVESLRIDTASEWAGMRVNQWMALVISAGAVAFLAADRRPRTVETATDEDHDPT